MIVRSFLCNDLDMNAALLFEVADHSGFRKGIEEPFIPGQMDG